MRKKLLVSAAALAALFFVTGSADRAEAVGFHVQAGGLHLDIGNPHRYGSRHSYQRSRYAYGGHAVRSQGVRSYHGYRGGHRGHRTWHDTTHLDWHPGDYVPHGNHFDYVPGHYDVHHDGHWDYHH